MRRTGLVAMVLLGALAGTTVPASAGPGDGLVVTGARIDVAARGRIRLSALFAGHCGFAPLDLESSVASLRIDSVEIVSLAGTRGRLHETRPGSGRFVLRERTGRRKVEMTIEPARGSLRLRGTGLDLRGVAFGGPFSVPVALTIGSAVRSGAPDFRDDGRTWRFDAAPALDGPQSFRRLGPGFGDGPHFSRVAVARTEEEWAALWLREDFDVAIRPAVDFEQEMVVGATFGPGDPSGEGATVTGVDLDANGLRIEVVERALPPSPFLGTIGWWQPTITVLVAVPRTDLPVTVVRTTIEVPRGTPPGCDSD